MNPERWKQIDEIYDAALKLDADLTETAISNWSTEFPPKPPPKPQKLRRQPKPPKPNAAAKPRPASKPFVKARFYQSLITTDLLMRL